VNLSAELVPEVLSGVVTRTATVPMPPGAVAVILVAVTTVNLAATVPNSTLVAPVRFRPVTVTLVLFGPWPGVRLVTTVTGLTTTDSPSSSLGST
jgi:hypothetical protein